MLAPLERTTIVGTSRWGAFPAADTGAATAGAIRTNPSITRCHRSECFECEDAIAGGPIE